MVLTVEKGEKGSSKDNSVSSSHPDEMIGKIKDEDDLFTVCVCLGGGGKGDI